MGTEGRVGLRSATHRWVAELDGLPPVTDPSPAVAVWFLCLEAITRRLRPQRSGYT